MAEPYYQDEMVTIYHGDCMDILPELGQFDLLLTDPPYMGLTGGYRHTFNGVAKGIRETTSVGNEWGAHLDWVELAKAVTGKGAVVFATHHSLSEIDRAFCDWRKVMLVTWYKRNAPPTGKNVPRFTSEFAWCFAKTVGLSWDAFDSTVFDIPNLASGCMATERMVDKGGKTIHPTQKPESLMAEFVGRLGPESVLDPFMGSGTTLAVCRRAGIRSVGIDREEKYCEIAARRVSQRSLFEGYQ